MQPPGNLNREWKIWNSWNRVIIIVVEPGKDRQTLGLAGLRFEANTEELGLGF